jgi:hypothetical protein
LDLVPGQLFFVALPSFVEPFVSVGDRQAVEVQALEDPSDTGGGHLDVVIALEVHRDLSRPEMVVLAEIEDLPGYVDMGGVGAVARSPGQIPQTVDALFR